MTKKFLRQDAHRHSRLGKKRKKLQKWRKSKGRDSKMRLKRKSYPASPSIGRRSKKIGQGKIQGKIPILVHNIKDLNLIGKDDIVIIARVGIRKRLEIIKAAEEKKIKILNMGEKNVTTNIK